MADIVTPDICVIGAGAGGIAAAMLAAHHGVSTTLVEKAQLGGCHLHSGTVPAQAFIAAAKRLQLVRGARAFGIKAQEPAIDFPAIAAHMQATKAALSANFSAERLNGLGVDVIAADGVFLDHDTLAAGDKQIQAKTFIVATGSKPHVPPIPGLDRAPIFTGDELSENVARMSQLVILGGNGLGLALAQTYRRFGSNVTIMEPGRALDHGDGEMRSLVLEALRREGVRILEGARIERVEPFGANTRIIFVMEGKSYSIECTNILVTLGREPAIERLNLEAAGVQFNQQGVIVDKTLRTSNARIYAIGDAIGLMHAAHAAAYQGEFAVKNALKLEKNPLYTTALPWIVSTDPEIAHVGLAEDEARQQFGELNIFRWPYQELERAHIDKQTQGFVKAFATHTGKILGASAVGANAGEILQMWSLAMQKGLTIEDMRSIVCATPTYSEANRRAVTSTLLPQASPSLLKSFKELFTKAD